MTIGRLKKRLTLQQNIATPDGGGGFNQNWQDVAEVFAHIQPLSSRIDSRFDGKKTSNSHRITIPYRDDVTIEKRLTDGQAIFKIAGVYDPNGEKRWLEIMAAVEDP